MTPPGIKTTTFRNVATEMSTSNISWGGGKCSQYLVFTTLPPSCADCLEILVASNSWKPQGLSRPVMGLLYVLLECVRQLKCLTVSPQTVRWASPPETPVGLNKLRILTLCWHKIHGIHHHRKFSTTVLCQCTGVLLQKLIVSQAVKKSPELRVHYSVHKIPSFSISRLCTTFRMALHFAVSNFIGHAQPPIRRPTRCRLPATAYQYICCSACDLWALYSIRNTGMRHVTVTLDQRNGRRGGGVF